MHANIPTKVGTLAIAIALSQALSFSFTESVLSSWHNTIVLCFPVFLLANEKPLNTKVPIV